MMHATVGVQNLNKRYGADVPLVLMNSFNTHEDTLKTLRKYQQYKVKILNFMQSR
jgi:UTP--glucose-1-phosphate uridylyltransferase